MANAQGQQKDTLPVQAYGIDGAVIRKIAVDSDGKVKISGGKTTDINRIPIGDSDTYFNFVAPDTLQLIVNGQVAQQWVVSQTNVGLPYGLLLTLTQPS